jgi:hypothetical protein
MHVICNLKINFPRHWNIVCQIIIITTTLDDILGLKIFFSNGYKFIIHVICFHLILGETKFWYVETTWVLWEKNSNLGYCGSF